MWYLHLDSMAGLLYPPEPAPVYPRPSVSSPGRPVPSSAEMLPLLHPGGIVYGQASRAWCHGGSKALHPVVHLHIIDHTGRIYLQKRALSKDLFPGYWDTAVGGHITYGESVIEALYREADEELGLREFNPIEIDIYTYESERDMEYVYVYAVVGSPALHPNPAEVSEGRWWKEDELFDALGSGALTPNFESEFRRIRKKLYSLL